MSARKPRCEAIVAEFVRWSQQCPNDAMGITDVDGDEFWVCDEHQTPIGGAS